ncbi:hypothetical protein [Roseateles violae]|uniref:Outer membrane beta-barrel porin/alpha-amylase n=1 Tax=Roseateles violae TaxID=3058042 RepID=A0ABT8DUI7_9BURK|nr:hypothetical protein [Pelomonas sp. PFR6]MDN3919979.1 hypothetical protein [Pelomonas sp. PFR6]
MKLSLPTAVLAPLLLAATLAAGPARAEEDWRYSLGLHDFAVRDVDSHTHGLNGSVSVDQRSASGRHLYGSFELFLDRDKDHLDSDHIPLWWQLHLGSDGELWRSQQLRLGWTADLQTRMNTVSGIERQITALPALVFGYQGQVLQASVETGAGWFFMELDDDAPKEVGYDRSTLRNSVFAYAVTGRLGLKLGESVSLSGMARGWQDGSQSLLSQYQAAMRIDASALMGGGTLKQPAIVLSADYHRYNLDPYNRPGLPPALRWNDDLLIRLAFETRW